MRGLLNLLWVLFPIVICKSENTDTGTFVDLIRIRRQALDRSTVLPNGYQEFPENNVAYKIYYEWKTWDEAREICQSDSGDLAIADMGDKIENMKSIYTGFENKLHVGIYKPSDIHVWKTVSNLELSSSSIPWLRDSDWIKNDRSCAVLRIFETKLEGDDCMVTRSFVCEIPIDKNSATGGKVGSYKIAKTSLDLPIIPADYTIFPNHNVAYKIYNEALTWEAARNICKLDGGDLAFADTVDKIKYIKNMDLKKEDWLFVGISKPANSEEWQTVEEVILSTPSIPWASWTLPDLTQQSDFCAAIALSEIGLGIYNCIYKSSFVCEIPDQIKTLTTTTTTTTETVIEATKTQSTPAQERVEPEPTTTTTSKNFPLRSVEFPQLGILYTFHEDRLTHHEAREKCFSDGGRLAVVDSFEKINVISKILDEESVHVGIRVSSINFEEWVGDSDGKPLKDLPWSADNPHPTKCAALKKDGSGLEETLCSNRLQYLCESWQIIT